MKNYIIKITIILLIIFSNTNSFSQIKAVNISGTVKNKMTKGILPYVNVILKTEKDSLFITGTVTDEEGRFTLSNIKPNNYFLEISYVGYITKKQFLFVGTLSEFLAYKIFISFYLKIPYKNF